MPLSEPLDILVAHDLWGMRKLLQSCESLTYEQFHRKFDIGPGSLHNTIVHILAAMKTWTETLQGTPLTPRLDAGPELKLAEISKLLERVYSDFAKEARRRPLDEIVSRTREGRTFQFTRGLVLTHVATHGMYHRAQCVNMLRQLGVKPLPATGMAEWSREVDLPSV